MRTLIYRFFLLIGFLLLTLQLMEYISIQGNTPDILLILVIYISHKKGVMEGQVTGFAAGLLEDIYSIELFGIHAFVKLIIGNLTGLIYSNFTADNFGFRILLGFLASLIHGILFMIAKTIFESMDVWYYVTNHLWIKILYTTVLTPFLFLFLEFLEKRFGEQ
ncbi:MAG TPA: rod shape-determining protein MreD [Spirochaetia bacterium]|nr:rod shape-determining protein MreD [Spirochaetia bacterium]